MSKEAQWRSILDCAHQQGSAQKPSISQGLSPLSAPIQALFQPLIGPLPIDRPLVIGHLAQSLDGCIARDDGESHWISGEEDLEHTHRLRALCDAVLVGVNTVSQDDCRLTVRRCAGDNPLRVILDPRGRLPQDCAVMDVAEAETLWVVSDTALKSSPPPGVQRWTIPTEDGVFDLINLLKRLKANGVSRLFVEGGGHTITAFLSAGLLDRLHLSMTPVLMGTSRRSITTVLGDTLSASPRPEVAVYPMGLDWLFDCDTRQT